MVCSVSSRHLYHVSELTQQLLDIPCGWLMPSVGMLQLALALEVGTSLNTLPFSDSFFKNTHGCPNWHHLFCRIADIPEDRESTNRLEFYFVCPPSSPFLQGDILINGQPLSKMRHWYVQNTGYVRQLATSFYNELTVRENLLFSMTMQAPWSMSLEQRLERVEQVIREVSFQSLSYPCTAVFYPWQ